MSKPILPEQEDVRASYARVTTGRGERQIGLEEIEAALKTVARIIDRYGDSYWPIFERLEAERDKRFKRSARLSAYLNATDGLKNDAEQLDRERSSQK